MSEKLRAALDTLLGALAHEGSVRSGPWTPVLGDAIAQARAALSQPRQEDGLDLPLCGAVFDRGTTTVGFRPEDMGCGRPIDSVGGLYRCAQCATPFHRDCIRRHFDWPEAGGSLMPHALDAGLATLRAALAAPPSPAPEGLARINRAIAQATERLLEDAPSFGDAHRHYLMGWDDARQLITDAVLSALEGEYARLADPA